MSSDRRKGPRERRELKIENFTQDPVSGIFYGSDNGGRRKDFETRAWFDSLASWPPTHCFDSDKDHFSFEEKSVYINWQLGYKVGVRDALRRGKTDGK